MSFPNETTLNTGPEPPFSRYSTRKIVYSPSYFLKVGSDELAVTSRIRMLRLIRLIQRSCASRSVGDV